MRATPAVRASARVPRATTRTPATTNRRAAMMTTLTLTLASTTRRDADARDDDDDDDAATFYARWPYREPRDVIPYLERRATRGDGASILEAYDAFFARYPTYALGRAKAALLGRELDRAPKLECCVEIGTFLGYSAIATAMRFKSARARMLCVEYEARHAEVARWALAYAGLDDRVRVLTAAGSEAVGDARAFVESVKGVGTTEGADVLFLDHAKERYLPDLKLYEDAGVVRPGTIVVADNVVYPGAPGYLEYVDSSAGRYDTHLLEAMFEYEQAALGPLVGLSWREALVAGAVLSQGGEFAFVIFGQATSTGAGNLFPQKLEEVLVCVVILSMALTPVAVEVAMKIAGPELPLGNCSDDAANLSSDELEACEVTSSWNEAASANLNAMAESEELKAATQDLKQIGSGSYKRIKREIGRASCRERV